MRRQLSALGLALAVSAAAHLLAVLHFAVSMQSGAMDHGSGGIVVGLGPAGRSPGAAQMVTDDGAADEEQDTTPTEEMNTTQRVEDPPAQEPRMQSQTVAEQGSKPVEPVKPESAAEQAAEPALEKIKTTQSEAQLSPEQLIDQAAVEHTAAIEPLARPLARQREEVTEAQPAREPLADMPRTPLPVTKAPVAEVPVTEEPVGPVPDLQPKAVQSVAAQAAISERESVEAVADAPQPAPVPEPAPQPAEREAEVKLLLAEQPSGETVLPTLRPEPPRSVRQARPEAPAQRKADKRSRNLERAARRSAGEAGASGEGGRNEAGAGDATQGGGAKAAKTDYYATLRAWIERHKRYPRRAKLRQEQGVVTLRFVVTRTGDIASFAIVKSSGHALLDEDAHELMRRVQPLPKIPPDVRENRLTLVIPIRYTLR